MAVAIGPGWSIGGGWSIGADGDPVPFNGFNTPALMNGSTVVANINSIAVNNSGLFVAVGIDNYAAGENALYATSTNGSTWTTPATMNSSTAVAYMTSVAVNSAGQFVGVGYNSSNYPLYATST